MDYQSSEASALEMIERLYQDVGEDGSPLPIDRTGGLRFRRGVPEALMHAARNNRAELERQARQAEEAQRRVLAQLGREYSKNALIAVLFWHTSDLSVWDIADSFGLNGEQVRNIAESHPTIILRCLDCDEQLRPQSRAHFQQMRATLTMFEEDPDLLRQYLYSGLHCADCTREREERWGEEWRRQEREYQQRLIELRSMPYQEYLQTPEWRRRRERKLDQSDHRCQFCNRHQRSLNVHHRTYKNLGEELDGDLIVLCRDCHSTFHEHRRLER